MVECNCECAHHLKRVLLEVISSQQSSLQLCESSEFLVLLLQKREDHSGAATYWVCPSHVGLIDEVFHDDLMLTFVTTADKREDVADADETVRIKEPLLVIRGKVGARTQSAVHFRRWYLQVAQDWFWICLTVPVREEGCAGA